VAAILAVVAAILVVEVSAAILAVVAAILVVEASAVILVAPVSAAVSVAAVSAVILAVGSAIILEAGSGIILVALVLPVGISAEGLATVSDFTDLATSRPITAATTAATSSRPMGTVGPVT